MLEKSESIKELSGALAKFQSAVGNVSKDGVNPYFKSKYATLENVVNTVRKPLAENGLSFCQFPVGENELVTLLMHSSGEFIKGTTKFTPKDASPQSVGSAITYMRRYALSAVLGIATEDDDDGNEASKPKVRWEVPRKVPPSDDEAGGNTEKAEQFLEQEEIEAVQKDEIKALLQALGKKASKSAVLEVTGLEFERGNYAAIIEKLKAEVDKTDPLAEAFKS